VPKTPGTARRADPAAVERRILALVGLGIRSRGAVVGVQQVRDAVRRGTLALALVATDASSNSIDKVVPLLRARRIKLVEMPSAAQLGAAVGREQTTAVGVVDRQLADGIWHLVQHGLDRAT
jgi:ribosomal protein L7Ae-like RNA K-turn-binding protein